MEAVIRRAVELQAGAADAGDGITEAEVLRIGRELGLPDRHMQQALAEVRTGSAAERGMLASVIGPSQVRVGRLVSLDAERAGRDLERYFLECEYMSVQRRRPGWTVYERAGGMAASMGRATSSVRRVNAAILEVAIDPLAPGQSSVMLAARIAGARAGFATGAFLGGGGGAVSVGVAAAIAVAPPAALLGLPVFAATLWAMRQGFEQLVERTGTRLESVLDRLESGELVPRRSGWQETIRTLKF